MIYSSFFIHIMPIFDDVDKSSSHLNRERIELFYFIHRIIDLPEGIPQGGLKVESG